MSLGKAILQIRHSQQLTQAEVGARAGVGVSYLSRLENGRLEPTMGTLQRIADALEVPVSRIFEAFEEPSRAAIHRCPVSTSGDCIGEMLRSGRGRSPEGDAGYGPDQLRLLRMTDFVILHGSKELRDALAVVLDALVQRARAAGNAPDGE